MSTITFGGSGKTVSVAQLSLQQFTVSSDLETADKVVVDNVVHIDHDHESDIIRIELGNDLKAPIVVNNTAYSPKKVFHVRPTGAIHTESNVYAHKVHAKYASGQQVDLLEHIDNETTDLQDDLDDLTGTLDSATHLDAGTDKIVKRSAALMTTINNLVVKADETNRSTALYPPPGLLFDKGFCETSLSCLNDAQVIFQPYDNGGAEIAGRSYTFGRSEDQDDEKDGLHFQDITDVSDTMRVRMNVGKTLPSAARGQEGLGCAHVRDSEPRRRHHVRNRRGGCGRVQGSRGRRPPIPATPRVDRTERRIALHWLNAHKF